MMSGIRGKNTQPELILRKGLFNRGIRFRLHVTSLPGRPDVVIHKHRTAILVHGCFWHAHQGCRYFRIPDNTRRFWQEKLGRNSERDARSLAALKSAGWRVAVVWECATRVDAGMTLDLICNFLGSNQETIEVAATPEGKITAVRS